jgi:N-formylglutamate amidohydrolase
MRCLLPAAFTFALLCASVLMPAPARQPSGQPVSEHAIQPARQSASQFPSQSAQQPASQPAIQPGSPPASRVPRVAPSIENLITTQRGDLPIIITAPHGGVLRVPGSVDRTSGITVRDTNTAEIALLTSQRIGARLGAMPWLVVAQFSRLDADANRDAKEAYENEHGRAAYEAFHAAVDRAAREAVARYGLVIVVDLHGQKRIPGAVVRGTRNGKAVDDILARHGAEAISGTHSIFGRLKAAGYSIVPDPAADELGEERLFEGGYITAYYGTFMPGVDAIQIELGSEYRVDSWKTAHDLGNAIADFAQRYLLE